MLETRTTNDGKLTLLVAGQTDLGCVRQNNEDSYGFFDLSEAPGTWLLVVCDGMGGAAGGEVASSIAVETISASIEETNGNARSALLASIERANLAIFQRSQDEPRLQGMGTTCTAALIRGAEMTIGHVGDSRLYMVGAQGLHQVTDDHSLAAELERRAAPGEPAPIAGKNVLTRCLGVAPDVRIDMTDAPIHLADGTIIVICSDGLSNMVADGEIETMVRKFSPEEACQRLIELARARGGPDNITVQIACLVGSIA